MADDALHADLERLAVLMEETAALVRRIAARLTSERPDAPGGCQEEPALPGAEPPATESAGRPEATDEKPVQPEPSSDQIERLIPSAADLLAGEPDRIWVPEDLVRSAIVLSEEAGLDYSDALADHLLRRLLTRGFLWKAGDDQYRAVVHELPEELEPDGLPGEIVRLEREIDRSREHLGALVNTQINAQIALWAARARAVQDQKEELPQTWQDRLHWVFGRLSSIVRDTRCGWVNPLNRNWSTDWSVYVAAQRGRLTDLPPSLTAEQEAEFYSAELRGLLLTNRRVTPSEADAPILDGIEVLGEDDQLVAECMERFGDPRLEPLPTARLRRHKRPIRSDREDAAPPDVPDSVLAFTRGRRALIAGGDGTREEHRQFLEETLEMERLDWETAEKGEVGPLKRMAERITAGTYDLVFFLQAFASHKARVVVDACRQADIPIIYLNRGYNLTRVIHEILEQHQPAEDSPRHERSR